MSSRFSARHSQLSDFRALDKVSLLIVYLWTVTSDPSTNDENSVGQPLQCVAACRTGVEFRECQALGVEIAQKGRLIKNEDCIPEHTKREIKTKEER